MLMLRDVKGLKSLTLQFYFNVILLIIYNIVKKFRHI